MRARYIIDAEAWHGQVLDWDVPVGDVAFAPRLTYAFTTGLAAARRGDASAAREALRSVRASRERLAAYLEERQAAGPSRMTRARVLEIQLEGAIQATEERWGRAIELLRDAAALEETIPLRFGPPFVDKPSYELLGEVLLEAGRAREAADAFETALARTPRRTLSMLGLADALRAAD
jgi:predicted Zn-dependent protease